MIQQLTVGQLDVMNLGMLFNFFDLSILIYKTTIITIILNSFMYED